MWDKRDMMLALLLHIGAAILLAVFSVWREQHIPVTPEHAVQVQIVSLADLQAMTPQKKPVPKPSPSLKRKLEKTVAKPKPKPKPAPQVATRPRTQEELDFDPFAPLESQAGSKPATRSRENTRQALTAMLSGQLSQQEIDRYIRGMQRAVEQQWKVPMEMLRKVQPALVELTLSPGGEVTKIVILESSGSAKLDKTLTKAIYAAAPFVVPKEQFDLFRVNRIRFYPLQ